MSICQRCHRPIKDATRWGGLGPVCAKLATPVPAVERDLFGFDIDAAAAVAKVRLAEFIDARAALAWHELRAGFKAARARVWEVRP